MVRNEEERDGEKEMGENTLIQNQEEFFCFFVLFSRECRGHSEVI